MFASARKAAAMLFDRDFRGLVFWTLVLTAILFVALFVGLEWGLKQLPTLGNIWVNRFLEVGIGEWTATENVDSAGDHQDLAAIFAYWPPLHQV